MIPFEQASYLTQVRNLRAIAVDVVKKYPINVKDIHFIKYSTNAIFKITDTNNKKYILRIHPPGYHTKNAILEEFKWLNTILETTDISVPRPLYNNGGEYLVELKHPEISTPRFCDLFEWLEGRFLWKAIDKKYAYKVGVLIAQLQKSGKHITIKHRHYWNADGLVGTEKARLTNVECLTGVSNKQQEIITAARRCTYRKLKDFENSHPDKLGLIHEDLNPNNIIIKNSNYGVIDFDDCGVGFYGFDFTEPLCAFKHLTEGKSQKNFDTLKEALFQGYSDSTPFTPEDIDMIPYFMLARNLCAIGSLELRKDNPKMRSWFQKVIERAISYFKKMI